jgi:hypothetical protein
MRTRLKTLGFDASHQAGQWAWLLTLREVGGGGVQLIKLLLRNNFSTGVTSHTDSF